MTTTKSKYPAVSIREIADLLAADRDTVKRAIQNAAVTPTARGARGHDLYPADQVFIAMLARRGADVNPELLTPADRKNLALAKRAEFELQIREGEYLPRDAIRSGVAQAYATVANALRSIPDLLERQGCEVDTCDEVERIIDGVCSDLANRLEAQHKAARQAGRV